MRLSGSRWNIWHTFSSPGARIFVRILHIFGVSSLSTPGAFQMKCLSVSSFQNRIKEAPVDVNEKERFGKHCQQPCPTIREESMGPNTYYQRRSRPSGHDRRPQVPPSQPTTRPVSQRHTCTSAPFRSRSTWLPAYEHERI